MRNYVSIKRILLNTANAYQDNLDHVVDFCKKAHAAGWDLSKLDDYLVYSTLRARHERILHGALYIKRGEYYFECDAAGFVAKDADFFDIVPR